jgi:hypothetical protein
MLLGLERTQVRAQKLLALGRLWRTDIESGRLIERERTAIGVTQPCILRTVSPTRTRDASIAGLVRRRPNQFATKGASTVEVLDLGELLVETIVCTIDSIEVADVVEP